LRPDESATGPPRLPFVLSVGVTGHRLDTLSVEAISALSGRVSSALKLISETALQIHKRGAVLFADDAPRFDFVSPLADGADQMAAEAALGLGYRLHAILPFPRADYREDLIGEEAKARFDTLLARSESCLELPGERSDELEAYVMTGRATVAHADMLIAVWDGLKARGRGGTAEVVEMAVARGVPVIHIHPDEKEPSQLLWAAFDPVVDTSGVDPMSERPLDLAHVEQMLAALLLPPPGKQEAHFVARFFAEKLPRFRPRIEYALLLAVAGVRPIRKSDLTVQPGRDWVRQEWQQFRDDCIAPHDVKVRSEFLENAYTWPDLLATHLAQTYRSGHVFSFVFGSFAVCMGLAAFMFPHLKFQEAFAELVITVAIILNAHIGTQQEWHRRWLDYRQLAERLRPMRSLKLLGIAAPDPPGTETNPVPERWIDWYAMRTWRAMGVPSGSIDTVTAGHLAEAIGDHEVAPQVRYHKSNAHRIDLLDQRLEKIGTSLFFVTLVSSNITLIGMGIHASFVTNYGNWFTLISAGFPALATAVFGIRFQGDFGGDALRSLATARTLGQIDQELHKHSGLSRAADLTEQAARIMLGDLDEWRLVNQQRDLSVG
jgi:hypothetical protein